MLLILIILKNNINTNNNIFTINTLNINYTKKNIFLIQLY